jgi:hypothetical protein
MPQATETPRRDQPQTVTRATQQADLFSFCRVKYVTSEEELLVQV